jgi:hypothetical protein
MRVTFKREPKETGLSAVANPRPSVNIKIDGDVVGIIEAPNWLSKDYVWTVRFMVIKTKPDNNPNCDWKWIKLKKTFEKEEDAREFVLKNITAVASKYTFKCLE